VGRGVRKGEEDVRWPLRGFGVVVVVLYSVHDSSCSIIWYVSASQTTISKYTRDSSRILVSNCFNSFGEVESGGLMIGLPVGLSQHLFSQSRPFSPGACQR